MIELSSHSAHNCRQQEDYGLNILDDVYSSSFFKLGSFFFG